MDLFLKDSEKTACGPEKGFFYSQTTTPSTETFYQAAETDQESTSLNKKTHPTRAIGNSTKSTAMASTDSQMGPFSKGPGKRDG